MKHKVKTSEDLNDIDSSCTDDESEDGKSVISPNDQDSAMSFESGNDEEIDAAELEEEDWIEYIKRSTNEAMKKVENEKRRCWNMTQRKNEMEIGDENRFITEWEMVDKRCWMESRTQLKIQEPTEQTEDQHKDGKMTSMNSSNNLRTRLKIWPKAATKSIKIGSTQQKTAEDGLYSRKLHNEFRRKTWKQYESEKKFS